jgi:hypothetical protein
VTELEKIVEVVPRKFVLYLSGPMTGMKDFNRPAFNRWARKLRKAGYAVINPAELPKGLTWRTYMARAKKDLEKADGIASMDGWMDSKGARLEEKWAYLMGLRAMGVRGWLA